MLSSHCESQEQIFDICGEEVNLYLAGVNRLEILEIAKSLESCSRKLEIKILEIGKLLESLR